MPDYLLGIDTGGTYTDGALLEQDSKKIVKTTKTLTTKHDLSIGILNALENLLPENPSDIKLVAISTTLATNAVAEGKGRPVALFLLGYDPDLVNSFNMESRFGTTSYHYFQGGHDLYANEQGPLDLKRIRETAQKLQNHVDAFAVSGYFSPFNSSHEEAAFQAISSKTGKPVVLGYELSTRLNSIQRATTASLNASLLSNLQDFIQAMQDSLRKWKIKAPLMVVRGDGALVSAKTAKRRPVETVHSGPAASAIGGRFLADIDQALVVDIGGTTTDIALIDHGQVRIREEGTTVGKYNTAVRAAHIHSLGLGGDSQIHINQHDQVFIGPSRVKPISALAEEHPAVFNQLKALAAGQQRRINPREIEYWYLIRQPTRSITDARTQTALYMLQEGPMALPKILERLDIFHPLQFGGASLLREEIIGRSALTPTDLLHVRGDFNPWNSEAATIATQLMASVLRIDSVDFINLVMEQMMKSIAREIITYLTDQTLEEAPLFTKPDDLGLWLFEENHLKNDPYLGCEISLKVPLVGIGAPASIFLPPIAELLHTDYISPPHFQVANAIGAAVGSIIAIQEAWVIPQSRNMRTVGFYVQSGDKRERFRTLNEALLYAEEQTSKAVIQQAKLSGIVNPSITTIQLPDGAESYRIRSQAIGSPDLGNQNKYR